MKIRVCNLVEKVLIVYVMKWESDSCRRDDVGCGTKLTLPESGFEEDMTFGNFCYIPPSGNCDLAGIVG